MHLARDRARDLPRWLAFTGHYGMEYTFHRSGRSIDSQQNTQVADRLG